MASNLIAMSDGLQPNSDGLQRNRDGLPYELVSWFFRLFHLFGGIARAFESA